MTDDTTGTGSTGQDERPEPLVRGPMNPMGDSIHVPAPVGRRPGGIWLRFVARFVDFFVVIALMRLVIRGITGSWSGIEIQGMTLQFFVPYMIGVLACAVCLRIGYHAVLTWRWGCTLGKRLVGLRVLASNGQSPGPGRSLARAVADTLNVLLGIPAAILVFDRERRSTSDHLSGTRVVRV